MPNPQLKRTPLNDVHRASGAKMVDFGGWDMPVQYSGLVDEHHTVRRAVGLFDVSHMGEIEIRGPEAAQLVDYVTTNAVAQTADRTGAILRPALRSRRLCRRHPGPQGRRRSFLPLRQRLESGQGFRAHPRANHFDAEVEFASDRYAQIAVQGPRALETLRKLTPVDIAAIRYYWFTDGEVCGVPARIARTGYTGEDGFEIYVAPEEAPGIWQRLLDAGQEFGIKPCGLGCRNTLRLESKMALYGHEIDASITPLEADLAWIVKLDKGDFIGRDALVKQKAAGIKRKLIGFEMRGRGIGRDGYEVYLDGSPAGWVTSGSPSPTLNKNIGLCYLPVEHAQLGPED